MRPALPAAWRVLAYRTRHCTCTRDLLRAVIVASFLCRECAGSDRTRTKRIAVVMRGRADTDGGDKFSRHAAHWSGSIAMQERNLFEPLARLGLRVDVLVSTETSAHYDAVTRDYRRVANRTDGEFYAIATKETSEQKFKVTEALRELLRLTSRHPRGQSEGAAAIWELVIFWRFDVQPMVPITQWRWVPGTVGVPWREGIPPKVNTCTRARPPPRTRSDCQEAFSTWHQDVRGTRISDLALIMDPSLLTAVSKNLETYVGPHGALHYILQPLIQAGNISYAVDGFFQSGADHENPLVNICRSSRACAQKPWVIGGLSHDYCCKESLQDELSAQNAGKHTTLGNYFAPHANEDAIGIPLHCCEGGWD